MDMEKALRAFKRIGKRDRREKLALGLGWTQPRIDLEGRPIPEFPIPNGQDWNYDQPPPEVEKWRSDYHWRDWTGACHREPPDPWNGWPGHQNNNDVTVLKRVLETWPRCKDNLGGWSLGSTDHFAVALDYVWADRHRAADAKDLPVWWVHRHAMYQVGDYATAALIVIVEVEAQKGANA